MVLIWVWASAAAGECLGEGASLQRPGGLRTLGSEGPEWVARAPQEADITRQRGLLAQTSQGPGISGHILPPAGRWEPLCEVGLPNLFPSFQTFCPTLCLLTKVNFQKPRKGGGAKGAPPSPD